MTDPNDKKRLDRLERYILLAYTYDYKSVVTHEKLENIVKEIKKEHQP